MPDIDTDALRQLALVATPGPWRVVEWETTPGNYDRFVGFAQSAGGQRDGRRDRTAEAGDQGIAGPAVKPYYQDDAVTLYCADNRTIFPHLIPKSFDLVLTDPPYTDDVHQASRRKGAGGKFYDVIKFASISEADLRAAFDTLGALARRWVVSFLADDHTYAFKRDPPAGLRFIRAGVWHKPNAAPHVTHDRPAQGWESIAMLHRSDWDGAMVWNGGAHSSVYTHPFAGPSQRTGDNSTAKPRPLIAKLISHFSNPGDLILDPFAGSGVTLLQAKRLGRRAVGIEIDRRQCKAIAESLYQEAMDLAS